MSNIYVNILVFVCLLRVKIVYATKEGLQVKRRRKRVLLKLN